MKLSIIIPIYNGEKYIKECIQSILNQTYKNIEILVIDDGSTDNTKKIISEFMDDRIKYFYKNNSGVSDSRNKGIELSSGNVITFVDADDKFINKYYLEKCINFIENNRLDSLKTSYSYEEKNGNVCVCKDILKDGLYTYEFITDLICHSNDFNSVWTYFIKKDIIVNDKVKFDNSLFMEEDLVFFVESLFKCEKIGYLHCPYYLYRYNEKSVTKTINLERNTKKVISIIKAHDKIFDKFNNRSNLFSKTLNKIRYHMLMPIRLNQKISLKELKKYFKIIYNLNEYKKMSAFYNSKNQNFLNKLIVKKKITLLYLINKLYYKIMNKKSK